tara:strand:+ start:127 stop:909 length:783 start_codon:yes stop_codon:yes gene_type:complete
MGLFQSKDGAQWIENPPAFGDIDIDNDGVMNPAPGFLIDLSNATSMIEGRQASMMAGYKIHSVTIGLRPVDDIGDNQESAFFAGRIGWYPTTDHAKTMLKLARSVEKATEATEIDSDSLFLSTEKDYSGLRFGWNGDNQVRFQTSESVSGYGNTQWDLQNLCDVYNQQTDPCKQNALFNGRAPAIQTAQWIASLASGIGAGDSPPYGGAVADHTLNLGVEALGGLIYGQVEYSSGDEAGSNDDDYYVVVTVNWTPEVSKW